MTIYVGPSANLYPDIVTDGLVVYLDAQNYTGGTTWYDLSGNGNNGTVSSGVQYSNKYGGSLYFDNLNDSNSYVTISSISFQDLGASRNMTIMFGAKKEFYGVGGNNAGNNTFFQGANNGYNNGWRIYENNLGPPGTSFSGNALWGFDSPGITGNGIQVTDSIANRMSIVAFSQTPSGNGSSVYGFLNENTSTKNFGPWVNGANVGRIGALANQFGVGKYHGYVSFFLVYDRPLSAEEIQQNFNAKKLILKF
jgi:hypothetical protein